MRRLRRVISRQSTSPQASPVPNTELGGAGWSRDTQDSHPILQAASSDSVGAGAGSASISGGGRDPSFLSFLGRSSLKRRNSGANAASMHRLSQSFSSPNSGLRDWRTLRENTSTPASTTKHKRTLSSILPLSPPQPPPLRPRQSAVLPEPQMPDFIGYPPGGQEIHDSGLLVRCEQKSPDICEYTVSRDSAGLRFSDMLAIALVSWAGHIFFRGPLLLAFLPMLVYLIRSSLQVYQESLVVIRNVGIQTEAVTLAGFRSVRSFELSQIEDLIIHEALQLFEYRYYMAILPKDPKDNIVIMFPHLLPRLGGLLPVYHGSRHLLFRNK
ncbi:hypothetical protein LPJ64_001827 [Coemansia asiatica]|uniref:Phosphatidylinositol N-acetylglucosaminyltransferase subunit H conserved domain-containing protein n=1 Tax=Coemansia asiatica TaxID=1052880 RepID=A0A9W8CLM9_9FUNG|nr:hypothetical protein LPJ64_001827 [Coemansia asiatica]